MSVKRLLTVAVIAGSLLSAAAALASSIPRAWADERIHVMTFLIPTRSLGAFGAPIIDPSKNMLQVWLRSKDERTDAFTVELRYVDHGQEVTAKKSCKVAPEVNRQAVCVFQIPETTTASRIVSITESSDIRTTYVPE